MSAGREHSRGPLASGGSFFLSLFVATADAGLSNRGGGVRYREPLRDAGQSGSRVPVTA